MISATEKLSRDYSFIAKADLESGGWVVVFPDLPGCITQADSFEEIGSLAKDAFETWISAQLEDGRPIPEPSDLVVPEWNWESAGESLISTKEVSSQLNISPRRVLALAKDRRLGFRYGRSVMFRSSDLKRLRPGRVGRPRHPSS